MNAEGEVVWTQNLVPQNFAAAGAVNGANYDRRQDNETLAVVNLGATDGTVDVKLQESADDGAGSPASWGDITGANITQIGATGDNVIRYVKLRAASARKKWLRAVWTQGAGSTGGDGSVTFLGRRTKVTAPTIDATV